MAEPRIKAALESADFTTDATVDVRAKLDGCLKVDHAHILPQAKGGKSGAHVTAIQDALKKIRANLPELGVPFISDASGTYGTSTADAVKKYKEARGIKRAGQPLDDIVGRMTITAMDDDLKAINATIPVTAVCTQNANIILDGTTAPHVAGTKMSASEWIKETQATFDTICSFPLGRRIVGAVRESTRVVPFPDADISAATSGPVNGSWVIKFTASHVKSIESKPGARADEVLVHEIIHVLDRRFRGYKNPEDRSMDWSGADFFTINGSNIYSQVIPRFLRKDHGVDHFALMPPRYESDAVEHLLIFHENYKLAFGRNSELFNILKSQQARWNPFASFTPNVTRRQFLVEIPSGKNRKRLAELFGDFKARWSDTQDVKEYGIGGWRKDGSDLVIDWKNGVSDRFREIGLGGAVSGKTKLSPGIEQDSTVTVPIDPFPNVA